MDEFLLEEYRVKWQYLRHMEQARESFVKWYVTVIGALVAFSLGMTAQSTTDDLRVLTPVALIFAVAYSLFVSLYLLVQKRNYRYYHARVVEIENTVFDNRPAQRPKSRLLSAFRIYYVFPTFIGAGTTALLIFKVWGLVVPAVILSFVYFLLVMRLTWSKAFA